MSQEIPKWLKGYIQSNDVNIIEEAVKSAELKTSGEIVPIIVHRSSTIGHVPITILLTLTTIYFATGLWHLQLGWGLPHWLILIIDFLLMIFLTAGLSRIDHLQRWLTPKADQELQTEQRALLEFYNHRVHHTKTSTGILIFLSIMEHRAIVLADKRISEKLPMETWEDIVQTLIGGIKSRQTLKGLVQAIEMSGTHLRNHFPRSTNDNDELENHLIIKE